MIPAARLSISLVCLTLVCLVFFQRCASSPQIDPARLPPKDTAIILVPGYQGTSLVTSDESVIWGSAFEALFGSHTLRLDLPGMGFETPPELKAQSVLERVRVVPFIGVDAYGPLLNYLREYAGPAGKVVALAYDWRVNLSDPIKKLDTLVRELRQAGYRHIVVVGHSMGGLITSYYLRYGIQDPISAQETWQGARLVDRAILAAVPFRGAMGVFRNMQSGLKTFWNKNLMDGAAVASFPSSYFLLPSRDRDLLYDRNLKPIRGAIHETSNWSKRNWGLLRDSDSLDEQIRHNRVSYTQSQLLRADAFQTKLLSPAQKSARPKTAALVLIATGQPTVDRGVWLNHETTNDEKSPESVIFYEKDFQRYLPETSYEVTLGAGDGSVVEASAELPEAFSQMSVREIRKAGEHRGFLDELDNQNEIAKFISQVNRE